MDQGSSTGFFRRAGQLVCFLEGGKGHGEAMGKGHGKFRGQGGAEEKNRLADAGLAQFGPFRSKSDAELLATGAGEGLGDRDEAVAIGVVFDDRENTGALGSGAPQGAEIRPQGGKGNVAPSAV